MKKNFGFIFFFLLPLSSFAVPSQKANSNLNEVLQLPIPNALKVLRNQQQHVPELSQIAFNPKEDMDRRWRAMSVLIQLRPSNVESLIERSLNAPEWYMRNVGLLGLQDMSPRNATEAAIRLLSDRAMVVRSAAVQVLEKQVGRQEVRDALWEEMKQERNFRRGSSLWIRSQIAEVLAQDPVRSERAQFTALIKESDKKIQSAAFNGLEKILGQRLGKPTDSHEKKLDQWRSWAARQPTDSKVK